MKICVTVRVGDRTRVMARTRYRVMIMSRARDRAKVMGRDRTRARSRVKAWIGLQLGLGLD